MNEMPMQRYSYGCLVVRYHSTSTILSDNRYRVKLRELATHSHATSYKIEILDRSITNIFDSPCIYFKE